jgi:UDP-N-acetylmuramoylalanine--D-glutamate ligase
MEAYKQYFAGKKVTLMGLGLLGRGVGDARFLAPLCKELIVTDLKSEADLAESVAQLKEFSNITYHLGGHRLEDFKDRDLIIKAAGVPLNSLFVAEAKKNNIPVRMSADLFAELSGAAIVGITGTRGKSTTAQLIAQILEDASKKILLGGNIRGISTLAQLPEVTPDTIAVLELDSWQLQGFGEAKISPPVAVFTTFMPDHMNYYKDDMRAYFADKANIFLNQHEDDFLIIGAQAAPFIKEYGYESKVKAHATVAGVQDIPKSWRLKVSGEHNRYNAGLAVAAARALGIDEGDIQKGVESFDGVPGRLQLIKKIKGVEIYNDNNATTPDATIAALRSFPDKKIILITGGADKGLWLDELGEEIKKRVFSVILLPGTGTQRLKSVLTGYLEVPDISFAISEALKRTRGDEIILFSPAFASFGLFKNEYDRNDQFEAAVAKLS